MKEYLLVSILIGPYHSIQFVNTWAKKRYLSRSLKNRTQQYANTQKLHIYWTHEETEDRKYKILWTHLQIPRLHQNHNSYEISATELQRNIS
jgi:hypothetical protein